jgi:hypothetical protein
MCSIKIPKNTTNCRACLEAMELLEARVKAGESVALVITFEAGVIHYNTPLSMAQMEKLNNQFKFFK